MGVWEWVSSATDVIRQRAPDVTPATDMSRKSYNFCRDSTTTIAREAHVYLSDDRVRDYVSRFAKNSALYVVKSYGGGPVIDIVSRSVQEKKADPHKNRIDDLETKIATLEKELSSMKMPEQSDMPKVIVSSKSQEEQNERLEDVLHLFMKEEFMGTKLFDNLMIPVSAGSKTQ